MLSAHDFEHGLEREVCLSAPGSCACSVVLVNINDCCEACFQRPGQTVASQLVNMHCREL